MKIFLTGGAGFIGSHLTQELLQQEHQVVTLDNFNDYYSPVMKRNNVEAFLSHPQYKLIEGDILNFDRLKEQLSQGFDVLIHLAARAGVRPSLENPILYEQVNGLGTMHLLECSRLFQIPRFIFASSSSVYGKNHKIPFSESDIVAQPLSPYAATKLAGELYCYNYHHLYNLQVACLRFFTVYGPRQRPDMAIHQFARNIYLEKPVIRYGDGQSSRDYTYCSDIVQGIMACLKAPLKYEIFNLGESQVISLQRLIELLETYLGKKAQIKEGKAQAGDMQMTCANIDKARTLLGYCPQVSVEVGLKFFVDWFLKDGVKWIK
ncbi:MAG: NAD-dependent epimerase/dehydratase family protein [Planctomycetota bacterium]